MKSRAYRAVDVNRVDVKACTLSREGQCVDVGCDVGKESIWVVLRWGPNEFDRPWKVKSPEDVGLLVERLVALRHGRALSVAMEPTGIYGDPLRQALADAKIAVRRVSPKMASDFAEVFDGVPSQHDGKDAAVVAELSAQGRSWEWEWRTASEEDQELEYLVDWLDGQRRQMMMWYGRLEAVVSRHWPEATGIVRLSSATLLHCMAYYGGPQALMRDTAAAQRLGCWGRALLTKEKREELMASAARTVGVKQGRWDEERARRYANAILECRQQIRVSRARIKKLAQANPTIMAMGEVVGVTTASVLWVHLGDPRQYHCGPAYCKAMGLNLAERSSGRYVGKLKISKRGPAAARRWLYLAALRWVRHEPVKSWYAAQKAARRGEGKPAVVGVMRKLAMTLYQVGGRGMKFMPHQLYARTKPLPA
jgi:transposase